LKDEIDKLQTQIKNRDKRIRELERQVAELTERLNAMNDYTAGGNAIGGE